jgi:hypothetical protein
MNFLLQLNNTPFVDFNDFIKFLTALSDLINHFLYLHVAGNSLFGIKCLEKILVFWEILYVAKVLVGFGICWELDAE